MSCKLDADSTVQPGSSGSRPRHPYSPAICQGVAAVHTQCAAGEAHKVLLSRSSRKVPWHGCHPRSVPCALLGAAQVIPVSDGIGWSPALRCWEGTCSMLSQAHGELAVLSSSSGSDTTSGRGRRLSTVCSPAAPTPAEACPSRPQGHSPRSALPLHAGVRLVGAGGRLVHRQAALLQLRVPRRGKVAGGRGGG